MPPAFITFEHHNRTRYRIVSVAWFFTIVFTSVCAQRSTAGTMPLPSPSASPSAAGPCAVPAVATVAVRPGIGRAPATSGAVCVAATGTVVLGFGYRDQTTVAAGRQHLEVSPEPVALVGIANRTELIIAPSLAFSRRRGDDGSAMLPMAGQQDAGIGAQYVLGDRQSIQQALALFATLPTGYPTGISGFSTGSPSYALTYAVALNFGGNFALSTSQGLLVGSGRGPTGLTRRYISYQPTVNFSYAIAAPTTLLLEDQITAPTGPQSPTGNRTLLALQQVITASVLFDAEYELNLLPAPGFHQHAFAAGLTVRF